MRVKNAAPQRGVDQKEMLMIAITITYAWHSKVRSEMGFIAILGGQTMVSGTRSLCSSREINLKGKLNLSYQTSVGKYFLKIMAKVDTLPMLASSTKRQKHNLETCRAKGTFVCSDTMSDLSPTSL